MIRRQMFTGEIFKRFFYIKVSKFYQNVKNRSLHRKALRTLSTREITRRATGFFLSRVNGDTMTTSEIKHGVLISLQDLNPSSPLFKQGSSLRVTGNLQEYSVEKAVAVISHGSYKVKIDTQHLRDLSFRVGSTYQFIGELLIQPDNEAVIQARVGRNVDGIDLNLYLKSLQLLRQFQAEHMIDETT